MGLLLSNKYPHLREYFLLLQVMRDLSIRFRQEWVLSDWRWLNLFLKKARVVFWKDVQPQIALHRSELSNLRNRNLSYKNGEFGATLASSVT